VEKLVSERMTPSFFYFSPLLLFFPTFLSFLQTFLVVFSSLLFCTFLLYQNELEKLNQMILKAFYFNNTDNFYVKIPCCSSQLIFAYVVINLPSADSSDLGIYYAYCSCCGRQRKESLASFCRHYNKILNVADSENEDSDFNICFDLEMNKLFCFDVNELRESFCYCPHILGIFLYCLRQCNPSSSLFFTSFPSFNSFFLSDSVPSSLSCLFSPILLLDQMPKNISSSLYQFFSYASGDFRDDILFDNIIECDKEKDFQRKVDFARNMRIPNFSVFLEYFVHQPTFSFFPDLEMNEQMIFSVPLLLLKKFPKVLLLLLSVNLVCIII
jgi:hypothetical protein